jgi:hypothetical protein
MSCSAPKISYLFQPAIMKLLNTYKLRIWQNTPWNMKTANHRTRLVLQCDCDFFLNHRYRLSKKESKGGRGQRKTSYECPIPKHWQTGKLHPKKCSNTRKEKIPIFRIFWKIEWKIKTLKNHWSMGTNKNTRRVPSKAWVGGVITKLQSKGSVTDRIWKDIQIKLVRNPLVQPLAEL